MRRVIEILLVTCIATLTSCHHKELCLHHPHTISLRVEFDWRDAPDATAKGMCVSFYSLETGGRYRFDFNDTIGGEIQLRVGKYRAICHNNDTEAMLFYNADDFETYGTYTRQSNVLEPIYGNTANYAPKSEGTEDERAVLTPDMMWGCCAFDIEVTDSGVEYICVPYSQYVSRTAPRIAMQDHTIILYPHELTCIYTYEVRNIKNLKHMSQMCGTLSGMSGMLTFFNEKLDEECITLPFESFSDKVSTVTGRFYTFGHHEENEEPHKMTFYVIMDDGAKYCYKDTESLDVTTQIHEAPNKRRVHIIIDGLDLPQPIENGHGFRPVIDDWIVENHDVYL
jgi:hypothetical protein